MGNASSTLRSVTNGDDAVRRVLAGDTEAFADIVREHRADVWKVVVAMMGDEASSDALAQQTFINAYERLDQYRWGDLARWLKAIARNLVRSEMRRRSREIERMRHYHDYMVALYEDDDRAEAHEHAMERAVASCRETMAPTAVRALTLYYDQGLVLADVAAAIGRSLVATRQLLFRARAAVRLCAERKLAAE